jgi:hypothetical protein
MHIYKGEFSVILSFLPSFLQFIGECEMWSYCFIVILCNPYILGGLDLKKKVFRFVEHYFLVRDLLGIGFSVCWPSG